VGDIREKTREKRESFDSVQALCVFFVLEIKQCVLFYLSVSKPPPVASPTNNWYQNLVRQKQRGFWGYIRIFKFVKNKF
jgi:hypothetical protein